MDDETTKYIGALRNINDALIKGLQAAISVLENVDKLTEENRLILIAKMKELVAASQSVHENELKH